jgi:hypothetical protein
MLYLNSGGINMPREITVSSIIERIRWRTGQDKSKFISDPEILSYVDSAAAELYDVLVSSFKDYFIEFANFNTISGVNIYNLPANCYKVRGLDTIDNSISYSLKSFPFEERARYINTSIIPSTYTHIKYCIMGNSVLLAPTPTANLPMTLWYVPVLPVITSTTQTLSMFSGYEEYLIALVGIRISLKAEEDPAPFERERTRQQKRIEIAAQQRDVSDAGSVIDTEGHETFILPY